MKKKTIVVEAILYRGENDHNLVRSFVGNNFPLHQVGDEKLGIETFNGVVYTSPGDYIIKDVRGGFFPCKPDIFKSTYEIISL